MATKAECDIKGEDFDEANEICVAKGASLTTYQGPLTLTVEDIRNQISFINSILEGQNQDAEGNLTITEDEMDALQKQAYSEFVQFAEGNASIVFSQEDFAEAVGATPDTVFDLYYKGIGDLDPLNLGTTEYITTQTGLYAESDAGKAAAAALPGLQSVFGTGAQAASWVPEKVTRRSTAQTYDAAGNPILPGVSSPTDYELMTSAQLAPYLPTAARDVTKISQNTPAYTAATAGLSPTLFDQINFPAPAITRGAPVISRGFDALGRPNTAITMGRSTATPTGPNIGNLNTWAQFPTTGMGIGPTGLGTTTTGTMGTTGNIVSTGADEITQFVDPNNALNTSSIADNVINTGGDGVVVTSTEVDLSTVPGSVAFCAINPTHDSCIPGTAVFCTINPNHASCQAADTCPDGQELWNGLCLPICGANETRDSTGICQSNDLGNCPVGTDQPGVRIPDGETVAWCNFPKCPAGTAREGVTIPVGEDADWCDTSPICPAGTAKENEEIPEGQTIEWCDTPITCPAGTVKENQEIPAGETEDWCSEVPVDTCAAGTAKENQEIPEGQTQDWCCATGYHWDDTQQKCEVDAPTPTCPVGTSKAGVIIPDNETEDSFCNCPTGQVWNSSTNQCEDRICPTGTVKEGDTIPDDQPDTWCDTTVAAPTCPVGTDKAGVIIPDDETEASFCSCPPDMAWNSSTEQCEVAGRRCPGGTAKVGELIPAGQPDAWCDGCPDGETWDLEAKACALDTVTPTVCPPGTVKAAQNIPEGQPLAWCDGCPPGSEWDLEDKACAQVLVPTPTCPVGTDKAGIAIPAGQTEASFCNCGTGETWDAATNSCVLDTVTPTTCSVGTAKAGVAIPAGQTEDSFCSCPTGQTWDAATGACVPVTVTPTLCDVGTYKEGQQVPVGETADVWCADPFAAAKATCRDTVGGATWDSVNNVCVPAATVDRFAAEKEACALLTGQEWNEYYMACVPVGTTSGKFSLDPTLDLTELDNAANARLSALGTDPLGTNKDPYSLGPDIGVVGPTLGGPAIPTTVPNINDVYFGAGGMGGGFGYAAGTAAGASGGGAEGAFGGENKYGGGYGGFGAKGGEVKEGGFAHGGEVEDRLGQRQNASDSRLMRHAGLGQFADEIGDEMLSTIARIMDRKD